MTDSFENINQPEMFALRELMRERTWHFDALETKINEINRMKREAYALAQKFASVDDATCFLTINTDLDTQTKRDIIEWRYHHGPIGDGDDHHFWQKETPRSGYSPNRHILNAAIAGGVIKPPAEVCPKCGAPMSKFERMLSDSIADDVMCIMCLDKCTEVEKRG